jgi:hypothetical protein
MALENFKSEIEDLDQNDQQVASMLGALKRVEAPADFDLQLKGRIARGAPATSSAFASWIRFAAIPGALGVLALFLVFSGVFTFNTESIPPVAEAPVKVAGQTAPPMEVVSEPRLDISEPPQESIAPTLVEAVNSQPAPRKNRVTVDDKRMRSASFDVGLGIANKVIQPRGFPPVQPANTNQRPRSFQTGGINVRDALSAIGIDVEQAAEGWAVKAVSANSAGGRSGIQAADLIEMIGDQAVKGKVSLPGRVFFDSITLVRSGKRTVIKLAGR